MTRYLFRLIPATTLIAAASVVFCTTASARTCPNAPEEFGKAWFGSGIRTAGGTATGRGITEWNWRPLADTGRADTTKPGADTTGKGSDSSGKKSDSLHFPIQDRRGDRFSNRSRNPFDLKDPSNIKDSIEYDPKTQQYYIVEKVGNQYYRKPTDRKSVV